MWSSEVTNMIITGIWETLYMTLVSTLVGYVIGLPMGIILTVSDKDGIKPNAVLVSFSTDTPTTKRDWAQIT